MIRNGFFKRLAILEMKALTLMSDLKNPIADTDGDSVAEKKEFFPPLPMNAKYWWVWSWKLPADCILD